MKKGLFLILIVCLIAAWGFKAVAEDAMLPPAEMPTEVAMSQPVEPTLTFSFTREDLAKMSKEELQDFMLLAIYTKMGLGDTWEPIAKKLFPEYLEKVEETETEESQQNQ